MFKKFKQLLDVLGHGQTIFGLLPPSVMASLATFAGYLIGFGPFVLFGFFIGTFAAIEFILWRGTTAGKRFTYLAILAAALLVLLIWGVREKSTKDNAYTLTFDDIRVLRLGETLPSGDAQVTGVNVRVNVQNLNGIPIYYKIERKYASVEGAATTLLNPGARVQKLEENMDFFVITDPIHIRLENGKYHSGETEVRVRYGKSPTTLSKRFVLKTEFQFFLCPRTGDLCGPVTMTNDSVINEPTE